MSTLTINPKHVPRDLLLERMRNPWSEDVSDRWSLDVDPELTVHPYHFCLAYPNLILEQKRYWLRMFNTEHVPSANVYDYIIYHLAGSLNQMELTHFEWEVEIQDHEVFPILRVCALREYLGAPHEIEDIDWKACGRLISGAYDDELAQGKLPYSLEKHRALSERIWAEENEG